MLETSEDFKKKLAKIGSTEKACLKFIKIRENEINVKASINITKLI